jgi:prophage DNA circulation protein
MPENPWEMIARSQRAAVGLFAETMSTVVEMGRAGVTRPEEVLAQVSAMAAAMGDLAGSTAKPLEFFLNSQRQLAETMEAFAVLQRQMAEVVESAAASHAAIVQALEMMSNPVLGVAHRLRSEDPPAPRPRKPRKT